MRMPVKVKRDVIVTMFGIGYYIPVNVYERLYAKWESFVTWGKFRLFILKDQLRYSRKQRSKRLLKQITESSPQGNRPDVW